jgi:hypothetical protein
MRDDFQKQKEAEYIHVHLKVRQVSYACTSKANPEKQELVIRITAIIWFSIRNTDHVMLR